MKIGEKLKYAWNVIKEVAAAVAVGFTTIILGISLSFVGRRKNVQDDRDPEDRIRDDTEKLRRDTDGLQGTTDKLSGVTDRLSENNERLRKLLTEFEEEELEE